MITTLTVALTSFAASMVTAGPAAPDTSGALDRPPSQVTRASDSQEAAPAPARTVKTVKFVYFVEDGETYRPEVEAAIRRHAFRLQRFWFTQFGGTFALSQPVVSVVRGDQSASWYDQTPDGIHDDPRWYRLGNISSEVRGKLGVPNSRYVSYPATTVSEPRVGANFEGAWMDGDDALCITGEADTYPYPDGNAANCLGHVAHEFGHIFGLDHEGPDNDCMLYGFYDVDQLCDFSPANREIVQNDPDNAGWLSYQPGDRLRG